MPRISSEKYSPYISGSSTPMVLGAARDQATGGWWGVVAQMLCGSQYALASLVRDMPVPFRCSRTEAIETRARKATSLMVPP